MMPPIISRRSLLAVASTGAVARIGDSMSFGWDYSEPKSWAIDRDLIALCLILDCPTTIGKACLVALPPSERGRFSLSRAIRDDVAALRHGHSSPGRLAHSIRERSRADFREGRVLTVNGWILGLTETRLYALAALLPEADDG